MRKTQILLTLALFIYPLKDYSQSRFDVEKTSFSTQRYDEFCPVRFDGQIIFCSNQRYKSLIAYQSQRKTSLYNIYRVILSEDMAQNKPEIFSRNLVTPFNDGPVAFEPGGKRLVYSRNIDTHTRVRNIVDQNNNLGLYFAENKSGEWILTTEFAYNDPYYSITTPCYSPDGKYLYFGSNMPGGYGGTDIYRSAYTNGEWGEPENLGNVINTPGNEVYPFVSEDGLLFFASDGHGGLGEKDIFVTQETSTGWSEPAHLEPPINSPGDDFGFITNNDFSEGYLSSNRDTGDDIYRFFTLVPKLFNCNIQLKNQYCYEFWDEQAPVIDTVPVTYEWEFSDGVTIQGKRVVHCLPGEGSYWARLNIIDNSTKETFLTQSRVEFEIVDHIQPYITCQDTVEVNIGHLFSGLESNLPDFTIEDYIWDFGDGGFTTGPEVTHVYEKPGIYEVKLGLKGNQAGDSDSEIRCVTKRILVLHDNPSDE